MGQDHDFRGLSCITCFEIRIHLTGIEEEETSCITETFLLPDLPRFLWRLLLNCFPIKGTSKVDSLPLHVQERPASSATDQDCDTS